MVLIYHDANSRWISIYIPEKLGLLVASDRKPNPNWHKQKGNVLAPRIKSVGVAITSGIAGFSRQTVSSGRSFFLSNLSSTSWYTGLLLKLHEMCEAVG